MNWVSAIGTAKYLVGSLSKGVNVTAPAPSNRSPFTSTGFTVALAVALAISVGGALYFRGETRRLETELERLRNASATVQKHVPVTAPAASDETSHRATTPPVTAVPAKTAKLDEQIASLTDQLARKDQEIAELRRQPDDRGDRPRRDRGNPGQDMGNFMQRLRENDPQRYQEMQARFKEMNDRMTASLSQQEEFLGKLDTAAMTPEQQDGHAKLLDVLKRMHELNDQIAADPEADTVPQLRQELFDNMRTARDLATQERQTALQDVARKLGYSEQEVPQFAEYINKVYESTSVQMGRFGGGRGGPPPAGTAAGTAPQP